MNNIELAQLQRDLVEFLGYEETKAEHVGLLNDNKLNALKIENGKIKGKLRVVKSNKDAHQKKLIKQKTRKSYYL